MVRSCQIDFVLLGAEGVVESGGIINKIGTSTIGLCAKMLNKPVYVAVESFKFVRFYPLNNLDIPDEFKVLIFFTNTLIMKNYPICVINSIDIQPSLPVKIFHKSIH